MNSISSKLFHIAVQTVVVDLYQSPVVVSDGTIKPYSNCQQDVRGQIGCDKLDIHRRSWRRAMLTTQKVFHVQNVRTTRENDAGVVWGGGGKGRRV